jgi:uncharacterized protein YcbK (DUF882 family)
VRLGRYFTLPELTKTDTGLSNDPPEAAIVALTRLVVLALDPLREAVDQPIRVTSGYRSPEVNRAVRGSPTSQHLKGEAADIKVRGWTAAQLAAKFLSLKIPFDQLITYSPDKGGHVHIGVSLTSQRGRIGHVDASGLAWGS